MCADKNHDATGPSPDEGNSACADDQTTGDSNNVASGIWWIPPNTTSTFSSLHESMSSVTSRIHPGHFFLAVSLPFCWSAYRGFIAPLDRVVVDTVLQNTMSSSTSSINNNTSVVRPTTAAKASAAAAATAAAVVAELPQADETIRRAVGSAVASRALRVATCASVGGFGLVLAGLWYCSNCRSIDEAVASTRQWAQRERRKMDAALGIDNRVDEHHPEYLLTQSMTEEEELEFVSKTYLPNEQWVEKNETASDKVSNDEPTQ